MIAPRSCGCFSTEEIAHRRLFIPKPVRIRAVWQIALHITHACAHRAGSAVHAFVASAIDQRASYLNPTVACAVLRRTATAMVAARFIQPLFDQSERALSVAHIRTRSASVLCGKSRSTSHIAHMHVGIVLAVPCNALAASATDPRARCLAAVQPLLDTAQDSQHVTCSS